ncbi:hypothetical protein HaLaN_23497 [Haematococcus lacustris]|uniref:Uncharacterized protein n=1 Tax=Haematococcus lacustris TaxID=44745 RepID=A0A6A0A270_HAELA|nr:hypothetical protein HaLaN_23497 [Haematococcus lacustris]
MHEAFTRQFVLLALYLSWLPLDVAEHLLSEMVTTGVARRVGVRITWQLGLRPGWETWGPCCGLVVDWCKRLGVDAVSAFVAFNLSDQQLKWVGDRFGHKDGGNMNVGRVVFNLGGGDVVKLRCGDEELAPPGPSPLPLPLFPLIWHDWVTLRDNLPRCRFRGGEGTAEFWKEKAGREAANLPPTPRDKQLQAGVVAAGRAGREAWKEKAGREAANLPPTPRDKQLQAGLVAGALAVERKRKTASALLGYLDNMRS